MNKIKIKNMEITELRPQDSPFPECLNNIVPHIEKLYCIGDLSLLKKRTIGIVGSRKCSEYGRMVAEKIGQVASENGVVTVSGMARGIDSSAHLGSLKGNGKTIAVLGSGIDIPYPRSNRELYYQIATSGLVISEYPEGFPGTNYSFPQRNRIIAALSEGLVVVEAGTKSGSLITAELSCSMGKQVFSVPGNINSPYSLGTNKLLMDGATPIAVIDDIFNMLGMKLAVSEKEKMNLGEDEIKILECLKNKGEISIDNLCETINIPIGDLNGIITIMEMKGLVAYSYGKIFIAKF